MQAVQRPWRLIPALLALFILLPLQVAAQGDMSDNAMIRGGVSSRQELASKIKNSGSLKQEFNAYGVTAKNVLSDTTYNGTVTRDGRVITSKDNRVVATNAYSYGRTDIPGSTKTKTGLFKRPTSVSFQQQSLPAYVHMSDGKFVYAVILDCGNVVTATPKVAVKKPAPQKTTVQTVATTPVVNNVNVVQTQTQTQSQTQTEAQTEKVEAKPLPETGPEAVITLTGLSALLTGTFYYLRSRKKLQAAFQERI